MVREAREQSVLVAKYVRFPLAIRWYATWGTVAHVTRSQGRNVEGACDMGGPQVLWEGGGQGVDATGGEGDLETRGERRPSCRCASPKGVLLTSAVRFGILMVASRCPVPSTPSTAVGVRYLTPPTPNPPGRPLPIFFGTRKKVHSLSRVTCLLCFAPQRPGGK